MSENDGNQRKVGVAVVGLGGAVATTAVAGIELLRSGNAGLEGLPLAGLPDHITHLLVPYRNLVFGGWDLNPDHLADAARTHNVLTEAQLAKAGPALEKMRPWPAVGNMMFCRNVHGAHQITAKDHRGAIALIQKDLRRFRDEAKLQGLVVINLASTERTVNLQSSTYQTLELFHAALDANSPEIGPAMLYAYAAISEGVPFVNFTPSVAADIPALIELAKLKQVPVCGKDGKTGQTMLKTVLAPALRARALHVDGWYSANILGNRDGHALDDRDSLASKLATKGSVLDQMVGYKVEDHLVDIRYYRPRGDNKESWDNIDITGFLGQQMQIKVNFLCRDSILAAPLVIELARLSDCAGRFGYGGVQEHLGLFFKSPMMADMEAMPEHALHVQQQRLMAWLSSIHQHHAEELSEHDQEELVSTTPALRS